MARGRLQDRCRAESLQQGFIEWLWKLWRLCATTHAESALAPLLGRPERRREEAGLEMARPYDGWRR